MSERSRTQIFQGLQPMVGEAAIEEMLSYFPARDVEEAVTKEFLSAELAGLRAEIAGLRGELHRDLRSMTVWFMGTVVGAAGVTIASVGLLL